YDVIFGVKALASSPTNSTYSGLYYMSALEDGPALGNGCGTIDSFYGSINSDGKGDQVLHERLWSPFCNTIDYESDDETISFSSNGNLTDINGYDYQFGAAGQAFVAIG